MHQVPPGGSANVSRSTASGADGEAGGLQRRESKAQMAERQVEPMEEVPSTSGEKPIYKLQGMAGVT